MLQITLDIENNEDEKLLLLLFKRLGIHYLVSEKEASHNTSLDYHHIIIEQGIDNSDFNQS
ncbi:MAG: hypothetical protein WAX77_05245 [Methylococcaceae bacterium]